MLKSRFLNLRTLGVTAGLGLVSGLAQAHTGHEVHTLMQGLTHPLGLDHLLAMVAVGAWSVNALPRNQAWAGPTLFLLALVLSACLGTLGFTVPFLEQGIAISVVLFGVMLALLRRPQRVELGLVVIALAGVFHGLAHGAEAPVNASFASYLLGFFASSVVLHVVGLLAGVRVASLRSHLSRVILTGSGLSLGVTGAVMLFRL